MNIKSFLLARLSEEQHVDADRIRAEIERHNDRTMVVSGGRGEIQTVTRCGTCANEYTRPCRTLKSTVSAYRAHPDFDPHWDEHDGGPDGQPRRPIWLGQL